MLRDSCLSCCRKHLAQAIVLLVESRFGYSSHRWLAIGHLAEAEAETMSQFPELAIMINEERKQIEEDIMYDPNLMAVIEIATEIAAKLEAAENKKAKKVKRKDVGS